jgi:hypothetical protein
MTEVINLNQKRKAKARTEKERKAAQNRIKFGRTKQEKNKEQLSAKLAEKHIQGHKMETEENE